MKSNTSNWLTLNNRSPCSPGFLVDYISLPVVAGFVSAAAITISFSQLTALTGIIHASTAFDFIESCKVMAHNFQSIRCGDTLTGILTILLLVAFKFMEDITVCTRLFGVISKSRYLIVIISGTLIAYAYIASDMDLPFYITGSVVEGHLPFAVPQFSVVENNVTTANFLQMVENIGLRVIAVPIASVMQLFIVAKVFSEGERIHVNQELLALGVINVCGSFLASIPCTGSFSRTAVNIASGVRSPIAGLITPFTVLVAIYFWSDSFYFIPKAVLAGMVICTMWPLIDIQMPINLWATESEEGPC